MTANAARAIPPMIATRTASCGVSVGRRSLSRYIGARREHLRQAPSSEAPSRRGPALARRAPAPAQLERVDRQRRAQQLAAAGEHGQCQQSVQQHGHDHVPQHERAHARPDVEHQRHGREPHHPARRGERADRDRQQAVTGVAHLAEATHAVAHRGEHQRGRPHDVAGEQVQQQTGAEAGGAARHAAAVVGDRGDHEYDQVGRAAEQVKLAERRQLEDHGHQQQAPNAHEGADREDHPPVPPTDAAWEATPLRVSTCTRSMRRRSANGLTCTRW